MIHDIVVNKWGYKLFFVESICDDPQIIEQNIMEVKVSSPDYTNMNTDAVLRDFLLRIEHYQEKYELLNEVKEKELSYMKIYNTGEKVVVHKHEGHIQSRIVYYLMNIHITPRTIYLTRVSWFNIDCESWIATRARQIHLSGHVLSVCIFSMAKVNTIWPV